MSSKTAPQVGRSPEGDPVPAARARPAWRAVALPAEHGGWGLTLEPAVLGLLAAPSGAGIALGAAALVAFVARTPIKVVLVDRWRHRRLPRTRLAAGVAIGELTVLAVLVAMAALLASDPFWVPLVAAGPLIGVELWFDMRSRSRRLVPELAGTVGIGSVAAAVVLAGGGAAATAAGAWLLVAARATASLPFVRFQLGRTRPSSAARGGGRQPRHRAAQDLAQGAAVVLAGAGVALGWLPWPAAAALAGLAGAQLALARREPPRAVIVGVQQLVAGLAVVTIAGLALNWTT